MAGSDLITEGQKEYIERLLERHQVEPIHVEWTRAHIDTMNRRTANRVIGKLRALPYAAGPTADVAPNPADPFAGLATVETATPVQMTPGVRPLVLYREVQHTHGPQMIGYVQTGDVIIPRGSYAISTEGFRDPVNETNFYRLWIGDYQDPKFHERMSMSQLIGPDKVKLTPAQRERILRMIAEQDPAECAKNYGLLIGKCGICGRRLTNDESRARGIGPVCAANWGWS